MIATDTGISSGHLTAADIFFLIATLLFVVEFVLALTKRPLAVGLTALGAACVAFGLFLL